MSINIKFFVDIFLVHQGQEWPDRSMESWLQTESVLNERSTVREG